MILDCPFGCGADDVMRTPLGPGIWRYECSRTRHHPGLAAYIWEGTNESAIRTEEIGGLAGELGLAGDLLGCLRVGEPWVEYGVVEHRYSERNPLGYQTLVDRFGHAKHHQSAQAQRTGPASRSGGYSASVYIAHTLSRMNRTSEVCLEFGPATDVWAANARISYWALPPAPPFEGWLTYKQFAKDHGLGAAA